ncbi:hypothetical protein [Frigoriglobus tundricola]|uniref:Uncharacterized protein n=1 Tax=Frigoriglobus tundricola TaxID=2774151 RepID=A0A6M5YRH0_9BACT|nr:hypothetical protein [Frigoriglobus tundricola]QJW96655.1 hypothetical protein FTUN_4212 [Frigoriglobus tundricola]
MPSRFVVAGIFAFWLVTTGYVAYRDLWPRVFASGPPPVSIELADEARQNVPARWVLYRNGDRVGRLVTQMKYLDADDAFVFTYRYSDLALAQGDIALTASEAVSEVRVSRAGDLKEQVMTAKVKVQFRGAEIAGTIGVRGTVTNETLTGRAELTSDLINLAGDLDPVPVPRGGQPLNTLQPVNRLGGLRGGSEWVVHESNPLGDALGELLHKKLAEQGIRLKEQQKKGSAVAEVGAAPQVLEWQKQAVPCWVIEYRRAEPFARTWVRVSDGKVLRQEAFEKGESLTFERED